MINTIHATLPLVFIHLKHELFGVPQAKNTSSILVCKFLLAQACKTAKAKTSAAESDSVIAVRRPIF